MKPPPRFNVQGVGVHALSLDVACQSIIDARSRVQTGYVCVTGVHGISVAQQDPALRHILNSAWLNVPDGMPLVWLAHAHGHAHVTRVYGPDLMLEVCDRGRSVGLRHFLYGGVPGVAQTLKERLVRRFPGLSVVGVGTPPFRPLTGDEVMELRQEIHSLRPDVLWIGLSTPKQERFMARHHHELEVPVMIGVGAAFDFHSGRTRQAPVWMRRRGLEWCFRLAQEPRRLGPRYIINNPLFVVRSVLQQTGLRRYPLESPDGDR